MRTVPGDRMGGSRVGVELPAVTFWPYFDTVTLKMYGNTVC